MFDILDIGLGKVFRYVRYIGYNGKGLKILNKIKMPVDPCWLPNFFFTIYGAVFATELKTDLREELRNLFCSNVCRVDIYFHIYILKNNLLLYPIVFFCNLFGGELSLHKVKDILFKRTSYSFNKCWFTLISFFVAANFYEVF